MTIDIACSCGKWFVVGSTRPVHMPAHRKDVSRLVDDGPWCEHGDVDIPADLCLCAAYLHGVDDSWHTDADHARDCSTQPPCGGCWSCMAATAVHWRRRRIES